MTLPSVDTSSRHPASYSFPRCDGTVFVPSLVHDNTYSSVAVYPTHVIDHFFASTLRHTSFCVGAMTKTFRPSDSAWHHSHPQNVDDTWTHVGLSEILLSV